jgi:hypothetical protein
LGGDFAAFFSRKLTGKGENSSRVSRIKSRLKHLACQCATRLIGKTLAELFSRLVINQLDKNPELIENLLRFQVEISSKSLTTSYARNLGLG